MRIILHAIHVSAHGLEVNLNPDDASSYSSVASQESDSRAEGSLPSESNNQIPVTIWDSRVVGCGEEGLADNGGGTSSTREERGVPADILASL